MTGTKLDPTLKTIRSFVVDVVSRPLLGGRGWTAGKPRCCNFRGFARLQPRPPGAGREGRRPSPDDRRGVAATEFALILPLFLLIVLGCIDYGRFAHTYIAVTNGARSTT